MQEDAVKKVKLAREKFLADVAAARGKYRQKIKAILERVKGKKLEALKKEVQSM